jgi:uncharacterized protein (TIGR00297 family)
MNFTPSSETDFLAFLIALISLIFLIAVSESLKKFAGVSPSHTRKIVHIATGVFIFFAPYFFKEKFYPALIPALFIPFNIFATRFGWLSSLHEQHSDSASRSSLNYGTVYFPIAFLLLVVLCWDWNVWILQTSMLVLGLGDAAASLVGEHVRNPHQYKFSTVKSIEGSLAMFVVSFLVIYGCLMFFKPQSAVLSQFSSTPLMSFAFALALVATAAESLVSGGADNLTVPLSIAFFLAVLERYGMPMLQNIVLGVGISFMFARLSLALKFLNGSGSVCTFLLASTIFSIGGIVWTIPILTFFFLSSILSKVGKARKKKFDLIFEKGSQRDMGQVIANGGVGWILMLAYPFLPNESWRDLFYFGYLGTMAAVQADTWATEIGTMIRNPNPISIVNFKPVAAGTSGGITVIGTLGAFLGALVIAISGWLSNMTLVESTGLLKVLIAVSVAGLVGSLVDSYFGGTLQAQYYDQYRDKITEKTHHLNDDGTSVPNQLIKGVHWIDNDMVNFACGVTGAVVAMLLLP